MNASHKLLFSVQCDGVAFECDEDLENIFFLTNALSISVVNVDIVRKKSVGPSVLPTPPVTVECNSLKRKQLTKSNCKSVEGGSNLGTCCNYNRPGESYVRRFHFDENSEVDRLVLPEGEPLLSDDWASLIKSGVGAVFSGGAKHFRTSLIKFSLKIGFKFKYVRNDSRYSHAACFYNDVCCDWFVKAKLDSISKCFVVCSINLVHKCIGNLIDIDTKRLVPRMVGDLFLADVKDNPNISGMTVIHKMKNLYGFDIPYWKAYRAVERARELIYGTFDDSYDEFWWYCDAIKRTNPGTVVELQCNEQTHQFERLFIAFKACLDGFRFCRPMIFLDDTFLKGRAKGTLLSATAKDGNNGLFPVAFAIVSAENNDN